MHADGETFTMAPLLMTRRSLSTQHQALPVHVRVRVGEPGAEAASLAPEGAEGDGRHLGRCRGVCRLGARLCQCRGADL